MARIKIARQRTDLPWAVPRDALWTPVIGACAVVVAPPADHPVVALGATTDAAPCPSKRQREQAHDARILARERSSASAAMIAAFKIFTHARLNVRET